MEWPEGTTTLDREQLREVSLEDDELMREVLAGLVNDTERQLGPLGAAIAEENGRSCARLAHYSKGACANVGAGRAARLLERIERQAVSQDFAECATSLAALTREMELLREEIAAI